MQKRAFYPINRLLACFSRAGDSMAPWISEITTRIDQTMYSPCSRMLFTRYMRPQKPYIDDYYFCVVKMEKGYPIAVSFAFLVPNRGFPPFLWPSGEFERHTSAKSSSFERHRERERERLFSKPIILINIHTYIHNSNLILWKRFSDTCGENSLSQPPELTAKNGATNDVTRPIFP